MTDTTPEITALVHARLMARTGAERFLMGVRMHEAARRMVMASLSATLTPRQLRLELRRRMYADSAPAGPTAAEISEEMKVAVGFHGGFPGGEKVGSEQTKPARFVFSTFGRSDCLS